LYKTITGKENNLDKIKLPNGKIVESYYDEEVDTLYFSFGSPKKSETYDTGSNILIRYAPENGEITGFTILNFSEYGKQIENYLNEVKLPV
jgi:uncharacterized protein YuzE